MTFYFQWKVPFAPRRAEALREAHQQHADSERARPGHLHWGSRWGLSPSNSGHGLAEESKADSQPSMALPGTQSQVLLDAMRLLDCKYPSTWLWLPFLM